MEKIVIDNFTVGGKCNLFHHGVVQDFLENKCFEFHSGNLYGLIAEFGNGGAAFSCGLTGNTNFYEGKVYIDDKEKSINDLKKESWYIGDDLYEYKSKGLFGCKPILKKKTIKEQIEHGISNKNREMDFYTIQREFDISNERINRNIEFVSGERWKASAAIGFANGKQIFCYPWMNSKDVEHLEEQLTKTIKYLIDSECIVIIPTTKEENIKKICKEGHIVFL